MLYSLTSELSKSNPTTPTNLYSLQCLPPLTHSMALQPPKKHLPLSLSLLPHIIYQNLTSTTVEMSSNTWLTNITLVWSPWTTHLLYACKTYWYKFQDRRSRRTSHRYSNQTFNLWRPSRETDNHQKTYTDLVTPYHINFIQILILWKPPWQNDHLPTSLNLKQ